MRIAVKAQVWIDGRLVAGKVSFAPVEWRVPPPAGTGERRIILIIERDARVAAGTDECDRRKRRQWPGVRGRGRFLMMLSRGARLNPFEPPRSYLIDQSN